MSEVLVSISQRLAFTLALALAAKECAGLLVKPLAELNSYRDWKKSRIRANEFTTGNIIDMVKGAQLVSDPQKLKGTRELLGLPELVAWGFEGPRALAWANGHVYVADAWETIGEYFPPKDQSAGRVVMLPSTLTACVDDACEPVEHRGLTTTTDGMLALADLHRQRLSFRGFDGAWLGTPLHGHALETISGVAEIHKGEYLVTTEGLPSVEASHEAINETPRGSDTAGTRKVDIPISIAQANSTSKGNLWLIANGKAESIDTDLHHPTGVAVSQDRQEIFVADSNAQGTTWLVYLRDSENHWKRDSALGMESSPAGAKIDFRGIEVSHDGFIFAAGNRGIYVFAPQLPGEYVLRVRVDLGAPIGGLVLGDGYLYTLVERGLYRMKTSAIKLSEDGKVEKDTEKGSAKKASSPISKDQAPASASETPRVQPRPHARIAHPPACPVAVECKIVPAAGNNSH